MMVRSKNWKRYLKDDAIQSGYELGWVVGYLAEAARMYQRQMNALLFPPDVVTLKEELGWFLRSELKTIDALTPQSLAFRKLSKEFYQLIRCSLASNRTPQEIYEGLRDDGMMRSEVIELLVARSKCGVFENRVRFFLNRVLSGNQKLRMILVGQKKKKEFPYLI